MRWREHAFAADWLERGNASFVTSAAPDAVVLRPDPVNARAVYSKYKPAKPDEAEALRWWPVHAAAASSGDLAFDTGPWVFGDNKQRGWFFTIWKRQPDGSWKWVLDHGFEGYSRFEPTSPVSYVRPKPGRPRRGSAGRCARP